jgi:hypothetical protein
MFSSAEDNLHDILCCLPHTELAMNEQWVSKHNTTWK